jgi:8-amino-7-oxononanoate synthase
LNQSSLDDFAARKLKSLSRRNLQRTLRTTDRIDSRQVRNDGDELISFACNDYLGLSHHPRVVAASLEATQRYGVGAGASRLISGNHPLYERLERQLADLKGTEDALVFGSGYLTNVGVIPVLAGAPDLILMDELCHSCLLAGAQLSRATVLTFRHNDLEHLASLLAGKRGAHRHCLVLTDGVFSMDGDLAPLDELARLTDRYDAWLMSDDAHGLGVIGGGRGSAHASKRSSGVPLQMGTLSKAVGVYGGYLCASRTVCALLRNRARSFVFSTGLPPGTVAAASMALQIIAEDPALVKLPVERARLFTSTLELAPAQSPIVPLLLHSAERALAASLQLRTQGFLVPAIRPPTVPPGTSRLRFAFSATHTEADVLRLTQVLAPLLALS